MEDALLGLIRQRIASKGPISFHDYMEAALYYPELGYYMADREKVGPAGDFFTSCCLGPVFGAMIAKQIEEMWRLSGEDKFTIVEFGAGDGRLCLDILEYFEVETDLSERLHYVIIEKSPYMRQLAQALLTESVYWYDSLDELGSFSGCALSNELLDNFAVHRVVMQEQLMEIFIDERQGLVEVLRPAGPQLTDYFASLGVTLPYGFCTEVNLEARPWLEAIHRCLRKGYVLTIDYGYPSAELYHDRRSEGTLLCYKEHQLSDHYYDQPGSRDITAHVNFSALMHWGEQLGLSVTGLASQAEFLLALDFKEYLSRQPAQGVDVVKQALQVSRLSRTLLVDMGSKFKVLIQEKGVPEHALTGLKFVSPGHHVFSDPEIAYLPAPLP